jgi:hypothetical protein
MAYESRKEFKDGEINSLVLKVHTAEEAQRLHDDYFYFVGTQTLEHELTAPELVKFHIGYALGYGAGPKQIEIWRKMGIEHPILGDKLYEVPPTVIMKSGMAFSEATKKGLGFRKAIEAARDVVHQEMSEFDFVKDAMKSQE